MRIYAARMLRRLARHIDPVKITIHPGWVESSSALNPEQIACLRNEFRQQYLAMLASPSLIFAAVRAMERESLS